VLLVGLGLAVDVVDLSGDFIEVSLHDFVLDLNGKDILEVLSVGNRVEGLLDGALVKFNLLADILETLLSALKVNFLYLIFSQKILVILTFLLNSLTQVSLLLSDRTQSQI
jgi:hypothetical protein